MALDVQVDVGGRLDGIDVQEHALAAPDGLRDVGDRLDRADLVVGEHDRDQDRAVGEGRLELVRIHAPVAVDRQLHDLEAELLEMAERVADGVVLDGGGHDPVAVRLAGPGRALEREVVRLRAAGREDDLAWLGVEARRDPLVRLVQRRARRAPERVGRRRIAERLRQVRQHRVEDLAPERGRRRVVEIDRHGRIVRRETGVSAHGHPGPGRSTTGWRRRSARSRKAAICPRVTLLVGQNRRVPQPPVILAAARRLIDPSPVLPSSSSKKSVAVGGRFSSLSRKIAISARVTRRVGQNSVGLPHPLVIPAARKRVDRALAGSTFVVGEVVRGGRGVVEGADEEDRHLLARDRGRRAEPAPAAADGDALVVEPVDAVEERGARDVAELGRDDPIQDAVEVGDVQLAGLALAEGADAEARVAPDR